MEWQFRINWQALVEEAKSRRKRQRLTQAKLGLLAELSTPTISRFESGEVDIQVANVLKIFRVLGMTDQRMLAFPESAAFYDASRKVVCFAGSDGSKKVNCAISKEALDDYFGGDHQSSVKSFTTYREQIEQIVRRKYLGNQFENDGSILVTSADVGAWGL
jgi:transcriptional regulator with XRE-family HTH domain